MRFGCFELDANYDFSLQPPKEKKCSAGRTCLCYFCFCNVFTLWIDYYKIISNYSGLNLNQDFALSDFRSRCCSFGCFNKIISKITSPMGAFIVGAFVTIFLLPCTIGPYIICGGILCPLGILKALPLLLLYNFVFVLPMLIMVLVIYFGLSKINDISSWQARNIKYLDLIAGLVIIVLGLAMVLGLV